MKALSLWQPWASLVALGVKSIETRSWSTKYRGPLLIHAAASIPAQVRREILNEKQRGRYHSTNGGDIPILNALYRGGFAPWADDGNLTERDHQYGKPLPLGAIVATCQLVDCLPIVDFDGPTPDGPHLTTTRHTGRLCIYRPTMEPHTTGREVGHHRGWEPTYVEDQRPYGQWDVGRFAWLLEDVKPTTERCPACWGTGCTCDDRLCRNGRAPACATCDAQGTCDPIPAKGKQGLWEWTP